MLIICTQDPNVAAWVNDINSNAASWGTAAGGTLVVCSGSQQQATAQLTSALGQLKPNDTVCITAHGSNDEIGDAEGGWTWSYRDIASIMKQAAPGFAGLLLVRACATQLVNFAAQLAVALGEQSACQGAWIYGFSRAIPVTGTFPSPAQVQSTNVEVAGVQI